MNVLAIDSVSSLLSVAVAKKDEVFYMETETENRQSEIIMECIDTQVKKAGLSPKDLNGVLCLSGPGSFTGLRIAYSICKGLALSLSIPFAAMSALECLALSSRGLTLALTEAGKNAYFYAFFRDGMRLTHDKEGTAVQILCEINNFTEQTTLAGSGAASFFGSLAADQKNIIFNNKIQGYANELLTIAKKYNIWDNDCTSFLYIGPEYIRNTV